MRTYPENSARQLFCRRIPWLVALMISATFTGAVITRFEDALAAHLALTVYIPMLMGTGGNAGAQASVTVIRALSLGELTGKDLPLVIWKELRTALLCALTLAIVCFGKIWFLDRWLLSDSGITPAVTVVVCLALFVTVLFADLVGAMLPLGAKRVGLDPAVMASPFITTIVDGASLLVYFWFAKLLLEV